MLNDTLVDFLQFHVLCLESGLDAFCSAQDTQRGQILSSSPWWLPSSEFHWLHTWVNSVPNKLVPFSFYTDAPHKPLFFCLKCVWTIFDSFCFTAQESHRWCRSTGTRLSVCDCLLFILVVWVWAIICHSTCLQFVAYLLTCANITLQITLCY